MTWVSEHQTIKIDSYQKCRGSFAGFITIQAGMIRIKLLFACAGEVEDDSGAPTGEVWELQLRLQFGRPDQRCKHTARLTAITNHWLILFIEQVGCFQLACQGVGQVD